MHLKTVAESISEKLEYFLPQKFRAQADNFSQGKGLSKNQTKFFRPQRMTKVFFSNADGKRKISLICSGAFLNMQHNYLGRTQEDVIIFTTCMSYTEFRCMHAEQLEEETK